MATPDQYINIGDLPLALGGHLPQAQLAYVTLGQLNAAGDNAVLILHGYTSSHRFVLDDDPDNAEGSWGPLIGPGKAIDTDRYFVVSSNALGSSYGSTGPGDINPATGTRWGPDFPLLTFEDQVNAQAQLLRTFGVSKLHAVIGLSMGGFGAFQWGVQHPTMLRKLVPVLTAPWGALNQAASHKGVTAVLQANAAWQHGWYYEQQEQMQHTLAQIRTNTLARYGVPAWLEDQLHDAKQVEQALSDMAWHWAKRFDANALLTLRAAINRFDVRHMLASIEADLMYVLCRTDSLFPPSIAPETMDHCSDRRSDLYLDSCRVAKYVEIDSGYGHFASSLDWQQWSGELQTFLQAR